MTQSKSPDEPIAPEKAPLLREMNQAPYRFDFFQALRRIESISAELPRVGHARQAGKEPVRIEQTAALDFAPATIDRIDTPHEGRVRISQRFFGLWGPSGPLPLHMTEQVRDQIRHQDDATQLAFLKLFHHRMALLFYRAWSSSRGAVQRDRPGQDRFAQQLAALNGSMSPACRSATSSPANVAAHHRSADASPTDDRPVRRYFTGRFATMRRTSEGLQAVVAASLRAGVVVETFQLRRLLLQADDRTRLCVGKTISGRGGKLGQSVVLGRSVPDRRSLITMQIGPLPYREFQCLLPGGTRHDGLRKLIRGYIDAGIDCRVRLILDHRSVPRMSLGKQGTLGRSAWLHSRPPRENRSESEFLV